MKNVREGGLVHARYWPAVFIGMPSRESSKFVAFRCQKKAFVGSLYGKGDVRQFYRARSVESVDDEVSCMGCIVALQVASNEKR